MFDYALLDMVELSVKNFKPSSEFEVNFNFKIFEGVLQYTYNFSI